MWYGIYKEASKTPLTEEQMLQIAIEHENGASEFSLEKKYKIGVGTFEKILSLFNVKKRGQEDRYRKIPLNKRVEIADDLLSGMSPSDIGLKHKISPIVLSLVKSEFDIDTPGNRRNPYRTQGIEDRVIELYHQTKSPIQVCNETGLSIHQVIKILEERNEPILHRQRIIFPNATDNQYDIMSQRYKQGEGFDKLTKEYRVNRMDFRRRLIEEGLWRTTKPSPLSEEQIQEAIEMTRRSPFQDIANYFETRYGISREQLRWLLDARGIPSRHTEENIREIIQDRKDEAHRIIPVSEYPNIRKMHLIDNIRIIDIAEHYGVGYQAIGNIIRGNYTQMNLHPAEICPPVQASFNLRRLLQASYSNEIGYLNRYLKEGFDPNDYEFELKTYLENQGQEFDEDLEYYDIAQEWLGKASKEDLEKFKKWVQNRPPSDMTDSPAYEAMSYNSFVKPTWLVHFTDDPYSIAKEGFKYGHEDTNGLALTTWYTNEARKRHAGYNFAFKVGSRDARICARQNKYGKHAVVFWGAGVEAYHSGDEEDQIIIWGPSVNTNLIFPVLNEEGSWVVNDWRNDKLLIKDDDFNKVAEWVVNNNQMLQQIRSKKT